MHFVSFRTQLNTFEPQLSSTTKPYTHHRYNSGGFVAVSHAARAQGVRKGDGIGAGGQQELAYFKDRHVSSKVVYWHTLLTLLTLHPVAMVI